jgi:coproporphyrinogen III oxidase
MQNISEESKAVAEHLKLAQSQICTALEVYETQTGFSLEPWQREGGGGGVTRVLQGGNVFEKAGIGFSQVWGENLPPSILQTRPEAAGHGYIATGLSMIVHPQNPFVPTVHFNYRFFQAGPVWWFGGGADLTPSYVFPEDTRHFHQAHQNALAKYPACYPAWTQWCEDYFFIKHRNEPRGVGGIFFDYQDGSRPLYPGQLEDSLGFTRPWEQMWELVQACLDGFLLAYLPIVDKRKDASFTQNQREFQLWRRGRYVEFNLIYDRGTLFGLQTGGRIESILMSLPPLVRWDYDWQPAEGSAEAQSLALLKKTRP